MYKETVAIIDIGSNTIRMAVYAVDSDYNYIEVHNVKTPARLSDHLIIDSQGQSIMDEAGIEKLLITLKSFKNVALGFNVAKIIPVATAAIRQSANNLEILQVIQNELDLDIHILSGREEASFGQYAVAHSTSLRDGITIDIGGGSCEVTIYRDKKITAYHSFPFGAVSLSQQFFTDKPHNDLDSILALRKFVRKEFKTIDWLKKAKLPIVGMGGSARNLANVFQRMVNYPMAGLHGFILNQHEIESTLELFKRTSFDYMQDIDGLSVDRIDIIIPATLVFLELYSVVRAPYFKVSTQGLREGIILHYINTMYNYPVDTDLIRVRSIRQIVRDFPINTTGAQIQVDIMISLYKQLCDLGLLKYSYERQEEVEFAAYLYRFANFISPEADSQHTFYLISNMSMLGFSHYKRLRLALLSSYRNRSLFQQYLHLFDGWLSDIQINELQTLGGVLRFSAALNDSKTGSVKKVHLSRTETQYILTVYHIGQAVAEKYRVYRDSKHFERALNKPLEIKFINID